MMQILYRSAIIASVCVATLSANTAVAQASSITDERAVLHLEDQFLESRVSGDAAVVRDGFAADGVFIQEDGNEQTKNAYMAEFSAQPRWASVVTTERVIHVYGDSAVTHAILYVKVGAVSTVARARETGVYTRQGGAWRIVSWQSTALTDTRYSVTR